MKRPFAKQGWGFAINYDREIAADQATLEDAERCLLRGWIKPDAFEADGRAYSLAWHLISNPQAAAEFGVGEEERLALAWTLEFAETTIVAAGLPARDPLLPDWYRVGDRLAARIGQATSWASDLPTLVLAQRWRRKAKSDLARHKRNQAKYGKTP